jgi:hypothetical protein
VHRGAAWRREPQHGEGLAAACLAASEGVARRERPDARQAPPRVAQALPVRLQQVLQAPVQEVSVAQHEALPE